MMSNYDPFKHHRKSTRKRGWDYRTPAYYFITVCTHERKLTFDDPILAETIQNAWRHIPLTTWGIHIEIDFFVVMPNHFHGIIRITRFFDPSQTEPLVQPDFQPPPVGSIGAIMSNFKSQTARQINQLKKSVGSKVWQRGYHDRIIRNEIELNAIRHYIEQNPIRWAEDRDNIDDLTRQMTYHP